MELKKRKEQSSAEFCVQKARVYTQKTRKFYKFREIKFTPFFPYLFSGRNLFAFSVNIYVVGSQDALFLTLSLYLSRFIEADMKL